MNLELIDRLSVITDEEQEILSGRTGRGGSVTAGFRKDKVVFETKTDTK